MMTGTTIAQIIPISVAPLLTRLFSPAEFGAFTLFMALASLLSIPATGRYDMAVVLPETDEEAMSTATLCLTIAAVFSVLFLALILAFPTPIARLFGMKAAPDWMVLLPALVFLLALTQTLSNWLTRSRQYRRIAAGSVTLHGTTATASLLAGVAQFLSHGLIFGRVVGQTAACVVLGSQVRAEFLRTGLRYRAGRLLAAAKRYRQFPLYSMPYSFIATFSKEFVIIAFSAFGQINPAGYFGLARNVLYLPMGFLSASLGQVFYKEAADHFGTPRLESLANGLIQRIAMLFTPPFVLVAFWAPDLFQFAFGENWREAGRYAALFSPAAYLYIFTGWTDRIFVVAHKQNVSLYVQVFFDVVLVALLIVMLNMGIAPLVCVGAITVVSVAYHLAYIAAVYRVAGFRLRSLVAVLARSGITIALLAAGIVLIKALPMALMLQFALSVALVLSCYIRWLKRLRSV